MREGRRQASTSLRAMKLNKKIIFKNEASLEAGLETRLQGREAMEFWTKTLRGKLRGRPGAMETGAKQYIYITKKGSVFGPKKGRTSRRANMGLSGI